MTLNQNDIIEFGKFDAKETEFEWNTGSNARCYNDCIGEGRFFCTATKDTWGRCCISKETCPKVNYCSWEAKESRGLQIWSCPRTPAVCGSQTTYTSYKKNKYIKPRGKHAEFLKGGAGCPYKILFPLSAGKYD